jgi:hypothetical protein
LSRADPRDAARECGLNTPIGVGELSGGESRIRFLYHHIKRLAADNEFFH